MSSTLSTLAVCQQVMALDAKYNTYRTPNTPSHRTMYIRRRTSLLRENALKTRDPTIRRSYMRLRSQLLAERYGAMPSEAGTSEFRSRSLSVCASQLTLDETSGVLAADLDKRIVPTMVADASRAMVGDTSIGTHYSFAGVHHIFDNIHTGQITRLSFANDSNSLLAIGSVDGSVSICHIDVNPGKSHVIAKLEQHQGAVTDVHWSSSNDLLLSCSMDGAVRMWSVVGGNVNLIRVIFGQPPDHVQPVYAAIFQPANNNLLITCNGKGQVQVVNISTGKYLRGGSGKVGGSALSMCVESAGNQTLWVGTDQGVVHAFRIHNTTGKLATAKKTTISAGHDISSLEARSWLSREASEPCLLVSVKNNFFALYSLNSSDGSLQLKRRFPVHHARLPYLRSNFCPLMSFREGVCVLSGSEDCVVYLWDVSKQDSTCLNKLQAHSQPVVDVVFNHDETMLASADEGGTVIIWKRQCDV